MSVPGFQQFMLPLLRLSADREEHANANAVETLANEMKLSPGDRAEMLPSGTQTTLYNRVIWSKTYLIKARLLEKSGTGRFRITPRGIEVLQSNPPEVNVKYLSRFPEFAEFKSRTSAQSDGQVVIGKAGEIEREQGQTPEEALELSYQALRRTLSVDLLERIKECSPQFFERLVIDLLVSMGYGGSRKDAGQAIGRTGDDGIDGIIKEDKLGLDVVYVQAKRWKDNVGRPTVQAFAGSLEGYSARKGVLITASGFSSDAREYVSRIEKKIVLIDGEQLAQLMIEHGVGVAEVASYTVKRIDSDYFDEE